MLKLSLYSILVFLTSDSAGLGASEALRSAGIENIVDPKATIYLLVGTQTGQLLSWALESEGTCRSLNRLNDLHLARVTNMFCIPSGEAAGALVSNGADNCIKASLQ